MPAGAEVPGPCTKADVERLAVSLLAVFVAVAAAGEVEEALVVVEGLMPNMCCQMATRSAAKVCVKTSMYMRVCGARRCVYVGRCELGHAQDQHVR